MKNDTLVGLTITEVRWMTKDELEGEGWEWGSAAVLVLSDGSKLYPSQDDEGNGPGALFGQESNGRRIAIYPNGDPS